MAQRRNISSLNREFVRRFGERQSDEDASIRDGQVIDYSLLEEEERTGANQFVPVEYEQIPFEEQVRHDFADLMVQDEYFPHSHRFSTPTRKYLRQVELEKVEFDEKWLIFLIVFFLFCLFSITVMIIVVYQNISCLF